MKQTLKKWGLAALPFLAVFGLTFGRYLYYGFQYFHQLDDYIQYHNYAAFNSDLWKMILDMGMLKSRPLAGVADVYLWSRFFSVMIVSVAILSVLYALSALMLKDIFRRFFGTGWLFVVVFTLLPLGYEGLYWVSASSRVICGIFFGVLAAWLLQRYFDRNKWYWLVGAILSQFLGGCFYEQAMVFSITLFVLMGLLNFKNFRLKSLWSGFSVFNAALYFFITSLLPESPIYGGRMELALPTNSYYFNTFLPDILGQLRDAFLGGGFYTLVKGFWRGLQLAWQDRAVVFVLLILGLCLLLWYLASRKGKEECPCMRKWIGLIVGILLAIAPVTPFLVLANPWFCLRSTVCSFAGIALIVDLLLRWVLREKRALISVTAACLAFVFCIAGISELHDYKLTNENDHKVASAIIEGIDLSEKGQRIGIIGIEPSELEDQNYFWHEHIHGTTESGWALTGLLQYRTGLEQMASVTPLPAEKLYAAWNYGSNRLDGFDRVYYYDSAANTLTLLTLEQTAERSFTLYGEDGALFGYVYDDNNIGKFKKA